MIARGQSLKGRTDLALLLFYCFGMDLVGKAPR